MTKTNKTTYIYFFAFFLLIINYSCQEKKKVESGAIDTKSNVYINDEIGWEISIPNGWRVMTVEHREALNEKGKTIIESAYNEEIDVTGLKNLLGFQKDRVNIFNSTSQPFIEEYPGEWADNNVKVMDIIYETLLQNGMQPNVKNQGKEIIDNVEFNFFTTTIPLPNDQGIITQILYSALINGLDFGVNINYTNENYGNEMLSAFRSSKFKKSASSKSND